MKKILIAAVVILGLGFILFANQSSLFGGRLVFFKESPEGDTAVSSTFVNYREARTFLINAAYKSGRISADEAKQFEEQFPAQNENTTTRAEFAKLAVAIFGITEYGYGERFSDLSLDEKTMNSIYLFNSNTGLEEFKPFNSVTWTFAEKSANELALRFPSRSK